MAKPTTKKASKPAAHKPAVKASVASRIAGGDQALLKRALKDPGLRSKLPDKYLPAAQRQARQLNQPVTPGSTMTQRMLATAATAAGTTAYGPKEAKLTEGLGIAQTQARDTGAFYQDYQRQLQAHAAAVQGYQAGAQAALAQTAQGVTGLAGQQQGDLQTQANQGAAAVGAAPAANMAPTANAAELSRQNLMGSFQAQQGLNAASQNTYADTTANVVAPTQKLSAEAQGQQKVAAAQKKISDLAGERGAAEQKYKSETTATEAKNVAATAIATGKTALEQQRLNQQATQDKAQNTIANRRITSTATTADKRIAAQKTIADARNKAAATTAADKKALAAGEVNKYGYTDAAWRLLSVGKRQDVIRAFGPKGGKSGSGPDWHTAGETGSAMTQLTGLKSMAQKVKAGEPLIAGHQKMTPLDRHGAARKILGFAPVSGKLKDPVLVTAALDGVYDGHLSKETTRRLIAAGYKPSQVAQTLGISTSGAYQKAGGDKAKGKAVVGALVSGLTKIGNS